MLSQCTASSHVEELRIMSTEGDEDIKLHLTSTVDGRHVQWCHAAIRFPSACSLLDAVVISWFGFQ